MANEYKVVINPGSTYFRVAQDDDIPLDGAGRLIIPENNIALLNLIDIVTLDGNNQITSIETQNAAGATIRQTNFTYNGDGTVATIRSRIYGSDTTVDKDVTATYTYTTGYITGTARANT